MRKEAQDLKHEAAITCQQGCSSSHAKYCNGDDVENDNDNDTYDAFGERDENVSSAWPMSALGNES